MSIALTPNQTQILETLVQQGEYPSLEVALNAALLLLLEDATHSESEPTPDYLAWLETTRQQIDAARAQAANRDVQPASEVIAALREKVQQARSTAS